MSNSEAQVVAACRRADQAFFEQVSQTESLDWGVAFFSGAFPLSADASQFREVQLGGAPVGDVFESVERYYAQRNLTCRRWVPAMGEAVEPFDAFFASRGWARRERVALGLVDWPVAGPGDKGVRIVPARAMRKAFRATFFDAGEPGWDDETRGAFADEAEERLNDSNYDVFVATVDDRPAGRVGYHEVGDIAAIRDLSVMAEFRGRGVGGALMGHVIGLAKRLGPRIVVASRRREETAVQHCFDKHGFKEFGVSAEYERGVA